MDEEFERIHDCQYAVHPKLNMALVTKQIGFTIDIDLEAIAPQTAEIFIYRLLNGLGNEHTISSVTVDEVTVPIESKDDLYNLSLGEDQPLEATNVGVAQKRSISK